MNGNFELGRIAGVRVRINWSWVVVFALIVWSLAAGVFPEQNPGLSDGTYLAMAAAAALLFFTSLVLHELGHARQALREGMEIEGSRSGCSAELRSSREGFPTPVPSSGWRSPAPWSRWLWAWRLASSRSPGCRARWTGSSRGSATSTSPCSYST